MNTVGRAKVSELKNYWISNGGHKWTGGDEYNGYGVDYAVKQVNEKYGEIAAKDFMDRLLAGGYMESKVRDGFFDLGEYIPDETINLSKRHQDYKDIGVGEGKGWGIGHTDEIHQDLKTYLNNINKK